VATRMAVLPTFCRRKAAFVLLKVARKVYVLIAVNAVLSRSSRRHICDFPQFSAIAEAQRTTT